MALSEVTDPNILKQLESPAPSLVPVEDPALIETLDAGVPFDFEEMGKNAPQSAADLATDITLPIRKPDEFLAGVGTIAEAMIEKSGTSMMESIIKVAGGGDVDIPTEKWDALWKPYIDKYSSIESFKRATEKDPFGVLADMVGVVGGAGAFLNATKKGVGKAIPDKLPDALYESAAKFSTTIPDLERAKMVRALLEENIPLDSSGIKKVGQIITDTNSKIDSLISAADAAGKTVPKNAVLKNVEKLRSELSNKIEAVKDRKLVDRIVDQYKLEVENSGNDVFTIAELQAFKKDAYGKITDFSKDKGNKRKTKDKIFRSISEAAKGGIESAAPGVKELNQRQAPLLGIRKSLDRAVKRIENRNLIGIDAPLKAGAGYAIADAILGMPGLGSALGISAHVLGRPGVKNRIARDLHQLKKENPLMSERALMETIFIALPNIVADVEAEAQRQADEMEVMP